MSGHQDHNSTTVLYCEGRVKIIFSKKKIEFSLYFPCSFTLCFQENRHMHETVSSTLSISLSIYHYLSIFLSFSFTHQRWYYSLLLLLLKLQIFQNSEEQFLESGEIYQGFAGNSPKVKNILRTFQRGIRNKRFLFSWVLNNLLINISNWVELK